jgi:hypothetical protein
LHVLSFFRILKMAGSANVVTGFEFPRPKLLAERGRLQPMVISLF